MKDLERLRDPDAVLREALRSWQSRIWTAMPAIVETFRAESNTVDVNLAVMGQLRPIGPKGARTGKYQNVRMPKLINCPVQFAQGGGLVLTFPIAAGDEGLVVFASRCIDGWWESGGIQPQAEIRMHDLSDGFFLPGFRARPNAIEDVSTTKAQLRTVDGAVFVEVGPGGVKIKGALDVEGAVNVQGNVDTTGTLKNNGINVGSTHTHSGVTVGGGNSGPPNP